MSKTVCPTKTSMAELCFARNRPAHVKSQSVMCLEELPMRLATLFTVRTCSWKTARVISPTVNCFQRPVPETCGISLPAMGTTSSCRTARVLLRWLN